MVGTSDRISRACDLKNNSEKAFVALIATLAGKISDRFVVQPRRSKWPFPSKTSAAR